MNSRITASLVVCVAAAGVAVGALALDDDDSPSTEATGSPTTPVDEQSGGYGGDGAGDATGGGDGGGAGGAEAATLEIRDFSFAATSVAPGGQVVVDNADSATHTATADDGAFDSGEVGGGSTTTFAAPTEPGSYDFACQIHPDMTGTLTVG
jgi:plastocyanin